MRVPVLVLAILTCLAGFAAPARALDIRDVRFGQHPDKTRMVVELGSPSAYRAFILPSPPRLVVDLPSYEWRVGDIGLAGVAAVSGLRQGPLQPGVSRIVVDLNGMAAIRTAFTLPAAQGQPDRLVIDFAPGAPSDKIYGTLRVDGGAPVAAAIPPAAPAPGPQSLGTLTYRNGAPVPPSPPASKTAPPPETVTAFSAPEETIPPPKPARVPQKKPVIVVDAGHGGVDPGSIGVNGVFEKHVTLAMARELKKELEDTGRYTIYMTRDTDKFLPLRQRVDVARQYDADLFISIHADTIGKHDVRGASIYTLSEKASDKETAALADRENKVDLIAGTDLRNVDKDVLDMLVNMSMRDTMNQSKYFANTVVDRLHGDGVKTLSPAHRYAGFAVLKAPDVPSVLIEIGFMSNKNEVAQLNDPSYRRRLGSALVKGIDAYFEQVRRNSRT
jgi:N-acetylmuramoyl-L-alanine amidase